MAWVWLAFCAFVAMLLETVTSTHGVAVPAVQIVAFYLVIAHGWQRALIPAAMAGAGLDVVLGRAFPCSLLALPVVFVAALFWRRQGDCRLRPLQAVPGAFVGLVSGAVAIACERLPDAFVSWQLVLELTGLVVRVMLGGAIALPALGWVFDGVARRLAVCGYSNVQEP
jgi:hypothetical protein